MKRQEYVERRFGQGTLKKVQGEETLNFYLQSITLKMMEHKKHIWLNGVDRHGFSVVIKVTDFQPTFLIRAPDGWDSNDDLAAEELSELIDDIHHKTSLHGEGEKIALAEFVYDTPFIGFTNRRMDRMVKFTVYNWTDVAPVVKYLKDAHHVPYHDEFDPSNQFLQQTNFAYQDLITVKHIKYTQNKLNHVNLEAYTIMENLSQATEDFGLPLLLKAFLRIKAISRDGIVDQQFLYKADSLRDYDRMVAIGMALVWTSGEVAEEIVHTIIPTESYADCDSISGQLPPIAMATTEKPVTFCTYPDEKSLAEGFRAHFVAWDPDDVFYFPDQVSDLSYFKDRAGATEANNALKLDRFKASKIRTLHQGGNIIIETRHVFNMEAALQKKVFISVESYDLYTCSNHSGFRKKPSHLKGKALQDYLAQELKSFIKDATNTLMHNGIEGRTRLLAAMVQDLRMLVGLEADCGMRGEFANISRASDTDITDCVSRGEQIRVFNRLTHFCVDARAYVNREKLSQKALRFRSSDKPPTFVDPPELDINVNLRNECRKGLLEKQNYHNAGGSKRKGIQSNLVPLSFVDSDDEAMKENEKEDEDEDEETKKHAKDGEEAEGGNVLNPSCKFWGSERVFIYDFKSLYPSIMMAYNISYENVIFDPEFMDLPNVKYIFVPINKYETVCIADMPGIIPKMLRTFVDNRDRIKIKMKNEKDPFKKKQLDHEQNSMKVLCNGTYGFCGAERGSILAMKVVMYVVCSLGRYLQKYCSTYLGKKYTIRTIYGDSVTEDTPILCRLNGQIFYRTIDDLPAQGDWFPDHEKECRLPVQGLEVWNDTGFTELRNIIRHKTNKKIYRVLTHTGCVCVTEDHSLLTPNSQIIKPTELKIGSELLHCDLPKIGGEKTISCPFSKGLFYINGSCGDSLTWTIHNSNKSVLERARKELQLHYGRSILFVVWETVENYQLVAQPLEEQKDVKFRSQRDNNCSCEHMLTRAVVVALRHMVQEWRELFYDKRKFKKIPDILFECDKSTRTQFFEGYNSTDGDNQPSGDRFASIAGDDSNDQGQIGFAALYLLSNSLGYNISMKHRNDQSSDAVQRIEEIPNPGEYVYDLTTENGHFAAGVGRMVVKNTDSIFTLIPLPQNQPTGDRFSSLADSQRKPLAAVDDSNDQTDIRAFCETVGRMYEMGDFFGKQGGFTWEQVVPHYLYAKTSLDVNAFILQHQINAILYLVAEKLCKEMTESIDRYPIEITFENMATSVFMGNVKKHYCYNFWAEGNPSQVAKIKVTGMPSKKREYAPFTRQILVAVTEKLLNDKTHEIKSYLENELNNLIQGKIPIQDLMVSKSFKSKSKYKHFRQIHLQVALKIEKRTRWPVKEKSRVFLVVLKGNDKLYLRSETPEFAAEHKLELDIGYYMQNQIYRPMKKLLVFHPELFNFDDLYNTYLRRLKLKESNMGNLDFMVDETKIPKKMSAAELIAKKRKTTTSRQEQQHKFSVPTDTSSDPFAKFFKSQ